MRIALIVGINHYDHGSPLFGCVDDAHAVKFILFFIHVDTRKVHIAGITPNPDGEWMAQQARNMCMFFDDWPDKPEYIVCDKDTKFTEQFEAILESDNIELKRTAVRAPNQNAYAERFAQTLQQECLDHFVVLGEEHLRHLIREFVAYYNEQRPHSSRGNLPLSMDQPPDPVESLGPGDVVCHERLGGLLRHYVRKAA